MVQGNSRKDAHIMIGRINQFLSTHSLGVLILLDHLIKFLRVVRIMLWTLILGIGLNNLFFSHQLLLGSYQVALIFALFMYQKEKYKNLKINNELEVHHEVVGGLVDVIQKTAIPQPSLFTPSPKKKTKLVN